METEQLAAYEWAKKQNYTSVAAQYTKQLAETIDKMQADLINENSVLHQKIATLSIENTQLHSIILQFDPDFFIRKCSVCGCD